MANERILVVDDEPQIRRALRTALIGHGYDVADAENGMEALVLLPTFSPHVVVLDLVMPGADGFDVLKDMRTWSQTPVIVLSARGQEGDKITALDLGADDYLTKPFGIGELLARIRVMLRRTVTQSEPVVRAGELTIDLQRHVVSLGTAEIHLTPTEFNLLAVLATNGDRVLTQRYLLEQVWGGYAAENAQQLRVYINYLRRKLESDPANPRLIVTEPGVGYRLRLGDA